MATRQKTKARSAHEIKITQCERCRAHLRLATNISYILGRFSDATASDREIFTAAAALHMAKAEKLKADFRLKHGKKEFILFFGHVADSTFSTT